MGKQIWQPVDPKNFGSDVSVRPSVCPSVRPSVQTLGEGEGSPKTTRPGEAECPFFLVGKVNNMAAGSSYTRFAVRY